MDELRESSLLFSLEGLLETERERVQREAREAERRREDELSRVAALAERRRIAAQQEREARERREVLERERQRLDQERIDAMKRATVERARIETEAELRLVEVEQARRHELELVKIRERENAARYRTLSWISGGAFALSLLGWSVAYFGFISPAQAQSEQQLRALVATNTERADAAVRALDAERKHSRELTEALGARPPEAAAPSEAKPAKPATPIQPGKGGHGPVTGDVKGPTIDCVDNGDPLNSCLNGARKRAR